MKGVFDTNILIDYLNGHAPAATEISKHNDKIISRVTWMEVLVGVKPHEEPDVRTFLSSFTIAELTAAVSEEAVRIRKTKSKIKLPDAIIYATAKLETCNLITRNTRDFDPSAPDVIAPYSI
jgi:predicted nucleic acid-binding protein